MWILKRLLLLKLVTCIMIQNTESTARIDALVDTKVGLIRGLQASDGDYAMFLGIPYAKVEGSNPFGLSVPFPVFEETFEAYDDSAVCPQMNDARTSVIGSLDCLHLNVFVPNKASSKNKLPVMVWIHGGAFMYGNFGRDSHGAKYLVKHDVILVTLNYRLGPYGFMCLNTSEAPGNQGLRDQQLALKWVHNNIEAFGGDINQITLFGESAGGASVDYHVYYSKEKNIFNNVIIQSGNALCPWVVGEADELVPNQIAKHLGFESDDVEENLTFLSATSPELVIAASTELNLEFGPCVENDFKGIDKFIGEHPINAQLKNVQDFNIMIGHNDMEGLNMLSFMQLYSQNNVDIFRQSLADYFNFGNNDLSAMEELVKHYYIGDDETISEANTMSIVDFFSDFHFNYPTVRSADHYLENGAKSVYFYVFSYTGKNVNAAGAAHADELAYLFQQTGNFSELNTEDHVLIEQMTTLWTNFAKTGNPTPAESDLIPLIWPQAQVGSLHYLDIGQELIVKRRPFHDRMAFWDLFYELNKKAQIGFNKDKLI